MPLYNDLEITIQQLSSSFGEIPPERKKLLEEFADYISSLLSKKSEMNFIFICTHNSRRSHISQIWAQTSAEYYGIGGVNCFSGGTEATAFNPRAVEALGGLGFRIKKTDYTDNPVYNVYYSAEKNPLKCFSKKYSDPFNPQKNFTAVMTCSDADENCPVVFGAEARFPVRYEDPKVYDGTEIEREKYSERVRQIGVEMLYLFSRTGKNDC